MNIRNTMRSFCGLSGYKTLPNKYKSSPFSPDKDGKVKEVSFIYFAFLTHFTWIRTVDTCCNGFVIQPSYYMMLHHFNLNFSSQYHVADLCKFSLSHFIFLYCWQLVSTSLNRLWGSLWLVYLWLWSDFHSLGSEFT